MNTGNPGAGIRGAVAFALLLVALAAPVAGAQDVSAEKFVQKMSADFGAMKDLEAAITWRSGSNGTWTGALSYKNPVSLIIKFSNPRGQVIAMNAEQLTIYVPSLDVVMSQQFKKRSEGALLALMTAKGLSMLQQSFTVAYLSGPAAVDLDESSNEQVYKLKLTPNTATTGFRSMVISVSKATNLYRRIEGTRTSGEVDVLDFTSIKVNQNLPDTLFDYVPPPTANQYPDFLFDSQQ